MPLAQNQALLQAQAAPANLPVKPGAQAWFVFHPSGAHH
jgi:hypothetical protein